MSVTIGDSSRYDFLHSLISVTAQTEACTPMPQLESILMKMLPTFLREIRRSICNRTINGHDGITATPSTRMDDVHVYNLDWFTGYCKNLLTELY